MNIEIVLLALDTLSVALSEHDHIWSDEDRHIYESALHELKEGIQTYNCSKKETNIWKEAYENMRDFAISSGLDITTRNK